MDQPHSHITSRLALRSDNKPGMVPHPGLSFRADLVLQASQPMVHGGGQRAQFGAGFLRPLAGMTVRQPFDN
jgi:hypothetical protein